MSEKGGGGRLLAILYLGLPGILLAVLGYYSVGQNSCQWYGDEYECWWPYDGTAYLFVISAVLLIAFVAVMILAARQRKR